MYVRPTPGLKIRDPELLDLLPDEGREVADSPYWLRRIADGDVIEGAPAKSKPTRAEA